VFSVFVCGQCFPVFRLWPVFSRVLLWRSSVALVARVTEPRGQCCNVVRLLADYLEHQLPPAIQRELEQHLQRCPRCVAQLHTYQSTVSLLRSLEEEELPAELRLTLKAFIDARCPKN
jgi:anti-sigma factor RsiW